MKFIALLIPVAVAVSPVPVLAGGCTFDQQGVASELHRIASRNPGFEPVTGEAAVEWHEASGSTVKVAYGGCVDLGAEILVQAPADSTRRPSTEDLIVAIERYWSAPAAQAVRAAIEAGQAIRTSEGDCTVIEVSPSDEFPFGATIRFEPQEASISWTVA